jgi:anti-sigma factor ChrR (cupin superfamily)
MKSQPAFALDPELIGEFAQSLPPIDPPEATRAAMRERLLARLGASALAPTDRLYTLRLDDGEWRQLNPLVEVKKLFQSGDGRALLYRFKPGGRLISHEHPTDEECVMLEGEVHLGDLVLRAGDFHLAPRGVPHQEIHSPTGALFYARTGLSERV